MKSFAILAAGAALAAAQSLDALPQCGQTCVGNMLGLAQSLGCSASDYGCLCRNVDFGYGVRDCSNQACPNASDAATVIAFGTQFCANYASASGSATGALPVLSSALETLPSASVPTSVAIVVTSPLVATSVSGDSTVLQTTGFVTITNSLGSEIASATDSAGSAISSVTGSAGSALSSATGSVGSEISSLTASASSALESATNSLGSVLSSVTGSLASRASSAANSATGSGSESTGGAPIATALPLAGAAGMAALLLL